MQYCSILASVHQLWKVTLHNFDFIEPLNPVDCLDALNLGTTSASKKIYWYLIENNFSITDSNHLIWKKNLRMNIDVEEWYHLFPNFLKWVKATKLRSFQYKLLMNSLTTNITRNKWNKNISDLCTFCQTSKETVVHLLYNCNLIIPMWEAPTKCMQELPNFINFMKRIAKWYNYDLLHAQENMKENKCRKKWPDIYC